MIDVANKASEDLDYAAKFANSSQIKEIRDFIEWVIAGNFILLGAKEFGIDKVRDGQYVLDGSKVRVLGFFVLNMMILGQKFAIVHQSLRIGNLSLCY